tara:strand:+ start:497 stop:808 length:312 start_codon:yes stop_codon:yes gene_type:complete
MTASISFNHVNLKNGCCEILLKHCLDTDNTIEYIHSQDYLLKKNNTINHGCIFTFNHNSSNDNLQFLLNEIKIHIPYLTNNNIQITNNMNLIDEIKEYPWFLF